MIMVNDSHHVDKPAPSYRVRREAMDAAVFELGPHARNGFEYTTFKCDGWWGWRATDEVRPPSAAEIKASGGKKAFMTILSPPRTIPGASFPKATAAKAPTETLTTKAPPGLARHPVDDLAIALMSLFLDGGFTS